MTFNARLGLLLVSFAFVRCSHQHILDITDGSFPMDSPAIDGAEAGAPDAADVPDGTSPVPPPRPVAPLSTSRMTSPRVTLSWQAVPGAAGYVVQFCSRHLCGSAIDSFPAPGTTFVVTPSAVSEFAPGPHLWRVGTLSAGQTTPSVGAWSPVWVYYARTGTAPAHVLRLTDDFDGDGLADVADTQGIAAGPDAGASLNVLVAWGPGGTDLPATLPLAASDVFVGLSGGDLDGDGFGDLSIQTATTALGSTSQWARGSASRTFAPPTTVTAPGIGRAVAFAIGDLDSDGYGDTVFTADGSPQMLVVFGSASGPSTSTADQVPVDAPSGCPAYQQVDSFGDFNGDGNIDFGGSCNGVSGLTFYSFDHSRTLSTHPVAATLPSSVTAYTVCDINGDGLSDYVFTEGTNVGFLLGASTGPILGAGPSVPIAGALLSGPACVGDFDGDGTDDLQLLVIPTGGMAQFGLVRGSTTGTPTLSMLPYAYASNTGRVGGGGDFNGDGFDDAPFVVSNLNQDTVEVFVYLGTSGTTSGPMTLAGWSIPAGTFIGAVQGVLLGTP